MKYYAGIGSRKTPIKIQEKMTEYAYELEKLGYILRSGGAEGADLAFEIGVQKDDMKEIYLPWKDFNNNKSKYYNITKKAFELGKEYHKGWSYLKPGAKKLMARNGYQVLGYDLKTPSNFILCWTDDGCESSEKRTQKTGGTGQAIDIAYKNDIKVYNLKNSKSIKEFEKEILKL